MNRIEPNQDFFLNASVDELLSSFYPLEKIAKDENWTEEKKWEKLARTAAYSQRLLEYLYL